MAKTTHLRTLISATDSRPVGGLPALFDTIIKTVGPNDHDEFEVRVYVGGKGIAARTYFGSDLEDALGTHAAMVLEASK